MWVQQAPVCASSALLALGVVWLEPHPILLAKHVHREHGAVQPEPLVSPHAISVQRDDGVVQLVPALTVLATHVVPVSGNQRPDKLPLTPASSAGKVDTTAGWVPLRAPSVRRELGAILLVRHLAMSAPMEHGLTSKAHCMQTTARPVDMRTIANRGRQLE